VRHLQFPNRVRHHDTHGMLFALHLTVDLPSLFLQLTGEGQDVICKNPKDNTGSGVSLWDYDTERNNQGGLLYENVFLFF